MQRHAISLRKKAIFGLLASAIVLLAVEAVLSILPIDPFAVDRDPFLSFTSSHPLFVAEDDDSEMLMKTANSKLAYFNAQRFPRTKREGTMRIFCLGGSTTFGRPYDDTTSFVGWLRELLQVADTRTRWEVINAGGISYASYRVVEVMKELCAYSPDVFILYTGHNEFLEERTYRDIQSRRFGLRQATRLLRQTQSYAFMHGLLRGNPMRVVDRALLPGEVDTILDHAAGPDAYDRDDGRRARILEHFQFNLARMIRLARTANTRIVLVTPTSNLKDFSPFKSTHKTDWTDTQQQKWNHLLAKAEAKEQSQRLDDALAALNEAHEMDDRYAELHFRRGHLLLAQRKFTAARKAFRRAIDEDVCPLRALSAIQRIVERTAKSHQVPLVDFDSILKNDCHQRYGHWSPGKEYFLDHVHPTIQSNQLLAVALMEVLIRQAVVSPNGFWRQQAVEVASNTIQARIDAELHAEALTNLAQVLSWAGKQEEAGPLALQAVRLRAQRGLSDDPESLFYAAVELAMSGLNQKAIGMFQRFVELEPNDSRGHWRLAEILYDEQKYAEAKPHFAASVRLDPTDAFACQMLGVTCFRLEQHQQALRWLLRAHRRRPGNAGICLYIASTFGRLNRRDDARDWRQKALELGADQTMIGLSQPGRP